MTTHAEPRTQLLLPGQAAAADGPLDLSGMFFMHHAFRRDLGAFAAAAARTPADATATWRELRDRWDLFGRFLHHHHSIEDESIWPLLLDRVDAAGRATLTAMEAEHGEIDPLLAACGEGFAALAERPDEDVRASLEVRVVAARERLAAHLGHEERDALPLVQTHLTAAEWQVVEDRNAKAKFTFRDTMAALPWALHGLPGHARRRLFAMAGNPLFPAVWRLLLRRPFERREARAFRYAAQSPVSR
jgi:hypothetical protein